MTDELKKLLSYLDNEKIPSSKLKKMAEQYSFLKKATVLNEKIEIDILDIKSILNPEKYKFETERVGRIGLEIK